MHTSILDNAPLPWGRCALVAAVLALAPAIAAAADNPVPVQGPGQHSTLALAGDPDSIRDDELAKLVADNIPKDGEGKPLVKDVKIMVNSCYGGGLLDDFQGIFGPGGACAGVPWVAGSAAGSDECAHGWNDAVVTKPENAPKKLGSDWTNALAGTDRTPSDPQDGSIRDPASNNVKQDLATAAQNNDSGPNHDNTEHSVVGSGNGGENITWNAPGSKHQAVVFGGQQTDQRHHNNVDQVAGALEGAWAGQPHTIQKLDGGTKAQLEAAIRNACQALDANTQLVLYLDDHGNTEFDIGEWLAFMFMRYPPYVVDFETPLLVQYDLHPGWDQGLLGMMDQADPAIPELWLEFLEPTFSEEIIILMNGMEVPLPPGPLSGWVEIPILPIQHVHSGPNDILIAPRTPTSMPLLLDHVEVSSGPINELDKDEESGVSNWQSFD